MSKQYVINQNGVTLLPGYGNDIIGTSDGAIGGMFIPGGSVLIVYNETLNGVYLTGVDTNRTGNVPTAFDMQYINRQNADSIKNANKTNEQKQQIIANWFWRTGNDLSIYFDSSIYTDNTNAVSISSPPVIGANMQYVNPNTKIIPITDPAQLQLISGAYYKLVPGNVPEMVRQMIAYGVSIYDVANATGITPGTIAAQLGQPDGFGGYTKPRITQSVQQTIVNPGTLQSSNSSGVSPVVLGVAALAAYMLLG